MAAVSAGDIAALDPHYANVVLLLSEGQFTSRVQPPLTTTINGDTKVSAAESPFQTPSIRFDGAGDELTIVDVGSDFQLEGADFTIEMWVYRSRGFTTEWLLSYTSVDGKGYNVELATNGALYFVNGDLAYLQTGATALPLNSWSHVAVSAVGSTLYLFINGGLVVQGALIPNLLATQGQTRVLRLGMYLGSAYPFQGNVDGVRITKGVGRYVSTFSPPTHLPTTEDPYYANTALLLSAAGAHGSQVFTDTSSSPKTIGVVGNTQVSTAIHRATYSMAFDGTGDYLDIYNNGNFAFPGDFTIEFWAKKSADCASGYDVVATTDTSNGSAVNGWNLELSSNRGFLLAHASTTVVAYATNPNDSTWHHWAVSRVGTTVNMFKDGVVVATATYATPILANGVFGVGGSSVVTSYRYNGYLDDLRVTVNVARYTTGFAAPVASFPWVGVGGVPSEWWLSVPALTPVRVYDALHVDTTGNTILLDQIGTNNILCTGVAAEAFNQKQFTRAGNENPWSFATPWTPPDVGMVMVKVKAAARYILLSKALGPSTEYMFNMIGTGQVYSFGPLGAHGVYPAYAGYPPTVSTLAVVTDGTLSTLYLDGVACGSLPKNTMPSQIGVLGYNGNGDDQNLGTNEGITALGVWSGVVTTADVQQMSAALDAALKVPVIGGASVPTIVGRFEGTLPIINPHQRVLLTAHPMPVPEALAPTASAHLQTLTTANPVDVPGAGVTVVRSQALPLGEWDYLFGGPGVITGTVKEKHTPTDLPLRRRVLLIEDQTRMPVREVWSDPVTGEYTFSNLHKGFTYTSVFFDHTGVYRAQTFAGVVPT